jgi:rubredoxin
MLARGLARRCPRCGAGHLFRGWFRMVERCPRCGYTFDREEGFFLGAFVINFGVTTAGLAVIMGVLIAVLAGGGASRAIAIVAVAAAAETVIVPVLFYPFSKTLWAAIDVAMHRGESWAAPVGGETD